MGNPTKINSERLWLAGLLAVIAGALALGLAYRQALLPFYGGLILAYAFNPLAGWLNRKGLSRTAAAVALIGALILLLVALVAFLVPPFIDEARHFAEALPEIAGKAADRMSELAGRVGITLPAGDQIKSSLAKAGSGPALDTAKSVFAGLAGAVGIIFSLVALPVFFFLLLADLPRLQAGAFRLLPPRFQPRAAKIFKRIDGVFSSYLRGQLSVGAILAIYLGVAFSVLGLKFALVIAVLAGVLNVLPFVGQGTGMLLAMAMELSDFKGWPHFFAVPAICIAFNLVDSNFLTPRLVGGKVGLNPLEAILALIIGASAGGMLGLALALPLGGAFKVLLDEFFQSYFHSSFYRKSFRKRVP
jgi:predicted PurR-regulated permease PerM